MHGTYERAIAYPAADLIQVTRSTYMYCCSIINYPIGIIQSQSIPPLYNYKIMLVIERRIDLLMVFYKSLN